MEGIAIFESDLALDEVNDASLCKNPLLTVFEDFYLPSKSIDALRLHVTLSAMD